MELQDILKAIFKAKWLIIGLTLATAITGLVIKFTGYKKYKSEAQLSTGITLTNNIANENKYLNAYEINMTFDNLIENMQSRIIVNQLIYALLFHDLKEGNVPFRPLDVSLFNNMRNFSNRDEVVQYLENKYSGFEILSPGDNKDKEILNKTENIKYDYKSISDNLTIFRVKSTDYISIQFESENPDLSAFVVNSIAQEFIRYYNKQQLSYANTSLESLQNLVDQKKKVYDDKLDRLKKFKDQHQLFSDGNNAELKTTQLLENEKLIEEEKIKIKGYQLSLDNINEKLGRFDNSSGNYSRLLDIERKIKDLNEKYVVGGNSDQKILDSLNVLRNLKLIEQNKINEKFSNQEERSNLLDAKSDLEIKIKLSQSNLDYLQKRHNDLTYSYDNYSNVETQLKSLQDEVDIAQKDYQDALKNYTDVKDKSTTYQGQIKQIQYGEPAENPEFMDLITFPIFAAFLSFFLSILVVVVLELTDIRIKNQSRFERLTSLKLSGIIPYLKPAKKDLRAILKIQGNAQYESEYIQELRKIRVGFERNQNSIYLFTSLKNQEGKSFAIVSLSYALSILGKKVLIIDTNFHKNSLTTLFKASQSFEKLCAGFSDENFRNKLINDSKFLMESFLTNIATNIYLLGSKQSHLSPQEIFASYEIEKVFDFLKNKFDYIFMEGAALNEFSDTKELLNYCSYLIPVFSSNSEIKNVDKPSLEYLNTIRNKLGPIILNCKSRIE